MYLYKSITFHYDIQYLICTWYTHLTYFSLSSHSSVTVKSETESSKNPPSLDEEEDDEHGLVIAEILEEEGLDLDDLDEDEDDEDDLDYVEEEDESEDKKSVNAKVKKEKSETVTPAVDGAKPVVKRRRRRQNRFNGLSDEEVAKKKLPDHIKEDLDILIVSFIFNQAFVYNIQYLKKSMKGSEN